MCYFFHFYEVFCFCLVGKPLNFVWRVFSHFSQFGVPPKGKVGELVFSTPHVGDMDARQWVRPAQEGDLVRDAWLEKREGNVPCPISLDLPTSCGTHRGDRDT